MLILSSVFFVSPNIFAKKKSEKKQSISEDISSEGMLQQERAAIKKELKNIYEPTIAPLRPLEDLLIPIGKNFEKLPFAVISEKIAKQPALTLRPQLDIYIRGLQHRLEHLKKGLGQVVGKNCSFLGDQRMQKFEKKSDEKVSVPAKIWSVIPNIVAKVIAKLVSDKPSDPIPELNEPLPFVSVLKSASYLDMLKIIRNLQQRIKILEKGIKNKSFAKTLNSHMMASSKETSKDLKSQSRLPIPELYEPIPWVPMATIFGIELAQAGALATILSGPVLMPITGMGAVAGVGIMAAAKKLSDHQRTIYLRSLQQELNKLEEIAADYQANLNKQGAPAQLSSPAQLPPDDNSFDKPVPAWGRRKPFIPGMRMHQRAHEDDNISVDLLIEAAESAE